MRAPRGAGPFIARFVGARVHGFFFVCVDARRFFFAGVEARGGLGLAASRSWARPFGIGLVVAATLGGCSTDRYARPTGPAPRYEAAPLPPWDAGQAPGMASSGEAALEREIERALAADAGP